MRFGYLLVSFLSLSVVGCDTICDVADEDDAEWTFEIGTTRQVKFNDAYLFGTFTYMSGPTLSAVNCTIIAYRAGQPIDTSTQRMNDIGAVVKAGESIVREFRYDVLDSHDAYDDLDHQCSIRID
jgi:hypothetical protein